MLISRKDTLPIANRVGMVINELNGINEAIFIAELSTSPIPNIVTKNTITKIMVIDVILELTSSVFETSAPSTPKIKA